MYLDVSSYGTDPVFVYDVLPVEYQQIRTKFEHMMRNHAKFDVSDLEVRAFEFTEVTSPRWMMEIIDEVGQALTLEKLTRR